MDVRQRAAEHSVLRSKRFAVTSIADRAVDSRVQPLQRLAKPACMGGCLLETVERCALAAKGDKRIPASQLLPCSAPALERLAQWPRGFQLRKGPFEARLRVRATDDA